MKLNIICPCCNKSVQVILSSHIDTGDVKVTGVFLNEENDDLDTNNQEELEKILAEKHNILFG